MQTNTNAIFHIARIFFALFSLLVTHAAVAGGGYFSLGYGPIARQMAGAVTAVAEDAFAGSSNPAKLSAVSDRFEAGAELFNPHRKVERTGSGTPFDFSSDSKNSLFLIPEFAYAHRMNDQLSLGVTVYANGGLNSEYNDSTGVPNTNLLQALGKQLHCDAIIQGVVQNFQQYDARVGSNAAKTSATLRYVIISTATGDILWEASCASSKSSTTTLGKTPPLFDILLMAQQKIVTAIPKL